MLKHLLLAQLDASQRDRAANGGSSSIGGSSSAAMPVSVNSAQTGALAARINSLQLPRSASGAQQQQQQQQQVHVLVPEALAQPAARPQVKVRSSSSSSYLRGSLRSSLWSCLESSLRGVPFHPRRTAAQGNIALPAMAAPDAAPDLQADASMAGRHTRAQANQVAINLHKLLDTVNYYGGISFDAFRCGHSMPRAFPDHTPQQLHELTLKYQQQLLQAFSEVMGVVRVMHRRRAVVPTHTSPTAHLLPQRRLPKPPTLRCASGPAARGTPTPRLGALVGAQAVTDPDTSFLQLIRGPDQTLADAMETATTHPLNEVWRRRLTQVMARFMVEASVGPDGKTTVSTLLRCATAPAQGSACRRRAGNACCTRAPRRRCCGGRC